MNQIYKSYKPYLAYTENTDEKEKLQGHIKNEFEHSKLSIIPSKTNCEVLDIGCGNGVNTLFLAHLFKEHHITGIDSSQAQIDFAEKQNKAENINYLCQSLEDWDMPHKFDFILASHVLQYISSNASDFVGKMMRALVNGGEAWIVQQTKKGMYEIIQHQKLFLDNPIFQNWKTFEDYLPLVEKEALKNGCLVKTDFLQTSFKPINFANPSAEDKLRLEFIFGLEKPFDEQSSDFKENLSKLSSDPNRISHPNGIIKIRKHSV